MPEQTDIDAKPLTDSSTVSTDVKDTQEQSSATETDASSTTDDAQTDVKPQKMTPLERAQSIVDASSAAREKEKNAEKSELQTNTDINASKASEKTNPQTQEADDKTGKDDTRFDKHPRFQELIKFKKEAEPLLQKYQQHEVWKAQNNVNDAELNDVYSFITALKQGNIPAAYEMLKPLVTTMEGTLGITAGAEQLPEALQRDVNEGKLSLEYAQKLHQAEKRQLITGQMNQRQQAQQTSQQKSAALKTWADGKRGIDTEFSKKEGLVHQAFMLEWAKNPNATAEQVVQLAEQSYTQVNNQIKSFIPAPVERKLPQSNGSQKSSVAELPKSGFERKLAIAQRAIDKHYSNS